MASGTCDARTSAAARAGYIPGSSSYRRFAPPSAHTRVALRAHMRGVAAGWW